MNNNKVYFTLQKAADELQISCIELNRMIKGKEINYYKHPIDGSPIFKKEELERVGDILKEKGVSI